MRTRIAAILLAVAILAFGVRAPPSSAPTATTTYWTITPAGTTLGIPASMFTLTDTLTGGTVDCPSGEPVITGPTTDPGPDLSWGTSRSTPSAPAPTSWGRASL